MLLQVLSENRRASIAKLDLKRGKEQVPEFRLYYQALFCTLGCVLYKLVDKNLTTGLHNQDRECCNTSIWT